MDSHTNSAFINSRPPCNPIPLSLNSHVPARTPLIINLILSRDVSLGCLWLLSLILMSAQWLRAKSSTWSSIRLFAIILIYSSSLNPGSTLPRVITTSKFQAISFSGRIEDRINEGAGLLFTLETLLEHDHQ